MISVYCDGSSSGGKDKPGGYGWVIVRNTEVLAWGYGGSPRTTNNLQELEAARAGLEALIQLGLHRLGEPVELVSDSQYTLGIASATYHASTNLEQTSALRKVAVEAGVFRYRWVPGHQGHHFNEICDKLAKAGKEENTPEDQRQKKRDRKAEREQRKRAKEQALQQMKEQVQHRGIPELT